jgi:hypothetical protein
MSRLIGVNERGHRVGEDNPSATLTDTDIDRMFELREQGWGYGRISRVMECSKSQAARILRGEHRAERAVRFKRG